MSKAQCYYQIYETDKGHIHFMIETEPTMSISKIVNLMKSYTTYHICGKDIPNIYENNLQGKNIPFGQMDIFACSVGNVSEEMLKRYIEKSRLRKGVPVDVKGI